jgi:hypothetical protein
MPDTFADASRPPEAAIEIRLSRPQQLFNSLDPSPFHERDLDEDAEAYIVDSADEFAMKEPLKLVIHLPADQLDPDAANALPQAIHHYFNYRLEETRRRLRFFFRDGRTALMVGLVFLFGCIVLRQLILAMGQGLAAEIATKGCTSWDGWPCGDPSRSFSTTGAPSGIGPDSSPSSPSFR